MKTQTYTLQIDALAAYRQIGVNLNESAIGHECAKSLGERLYKCITTQMLAECLLDATKKQKSKRALRKSGVPSVEEPKTGGSNHEA